MFIAIFLNTFLFAYLVCTFSPYVTSACVQIFIPGNNLPCPHILPRSLFSFFHSIIPKLFLLKLPSRSASISIDLDGSVVWKSSVSFLSLRSFPTIMDILSFTLLSFYSASCFMNYRLSFTNTSVIETLKICLYEMRLLTTISHQICSVDEIK